MLTAREPWLLENVVGVGKLPGAEVNYEAGWDWQPTDVGAGG